MSFIVKGLDIPKEGQMLSINIYPDGKVTYNLDLECKQIAVAKPVPTPHGRLMDADRMRNEESERYAIMMFGLADTKELPPSVVSLLNEAVRRQVIALIESMPTVIEAEE